MYVARKLTILTVVFGRYWRQRMSIKVLYERTQLVDYSHPMIIVGP